MDASTIREAAQKIEVVAKTMIEMAILTLILIHPHIPLEMQMLSPLTELNGETKMEMVTEITKSVSNQILALTHMELANSRLRMENSMIGMAVLTKIMMDYMMAMINVH
jgi:hypothetical protein